MEFTFDKELRIGQVIEIRGKKVVCRIFENKNGPYIFINGDIIKNISMGSYVIIPVGFNLIIGKIDGEYAVEKNIDSILYNEIELFSRKIEISIFGTYENKRFNLGISVMPLINSDVYIAPNEMLKDVFNFSNNLNHIKSDIDEELSIFIGNDTDNKLPVYVSIEKLFANHIGIFGNTGSGKSNTLAFLYTSLFDKLEFNKKHEFIFLDYSNEYSNCFTENKTVINLGEKNSELLYLPKDAVFNQEFWLSITEAAEKTHTPFIRDTIKKYYDVSFLKLRNDLNSLKEKIPKDEKGKKSFLQIESFLDDREEDEFSKFYGCALYIAIYKYSTDKSKYLDNNFWTLLNRIQQQCYNLYKFVKFTKPVNEYANIMVINLNRLSLENKLIISYLISNRYYKLFCERTSENNTINLIIDEAHKILSIPKESDKTPFKEYLLSRFEEFIKEGRKFGFYLTIASQRPSDISSMFLSQMHNYFVHRLVNQNDIDNLKNSISFLDDTSFKMISSLKVGTCIYSGLAAGFPLLIDIPKLDDKKSPHSNNISITAETKCLQNN